MTSIIVPDRAPGWRRADQREFTVQMFAVFAVIRKPFQWVALLLPAIFLAACEPVTLGGGSGGPSVDPSASVPVALLVPHGSANANEQKLARDLENAARLAVADLSGVQHGRQCRPGPDRRANRRG